MGLEYFTLQEAVDEARGVYLNDDAAQRYTDSRMLTVIQSVLDTILLKLVESNVPYTKTTLGPFNLLAADTTIEIFSQDNTVPIVPIRAREAPLGQVTFSPMIEQDWIDRNLALTPGTYRTFWRWGLAPGSATDIPIMKFQCPPGTVTSTIYIDCRMATPDTSVTALATSIKLPGLKNYFAARLAAVASAFIGNNPTRAQECNAIAEDILKSYMNINVKKNQSLPKRRRAFNYLKRNGWRFWS